jgi:hypothetical protein
VVGSTFFSPGASKHKQNDQSPEVSAGSDTEQARVAPPLSAWLSKIVLSAIPALLQPIGVFHQPVREILRYFPRLVLIQSMLGD